MSFPHLYTQKSILRGQGRGGFPAAGRGRMVVTGLQGSRMGNTTKM